MSQAYACRISLENMGAIASEKPDFDREVYLMFLREHIGGFFIRDEGSPFDCAYMADLVFHQIYKFETKFDEKEIFHRVVRLGPPFRKE